MKTKSVSVIGATGMVGRELLRILEERSFPISTIKLFSSSTSAGEKIEFNGDEVAVEELTSPTQITTDIAFLRPVARSQVHLWIKWREMVRFVSINLAPCACVTMWL